MSPLSPTYEPLLADSEHDLENLKQPPPHLPARQRFLPWVVTVLAFSLLANGLQFWVSRTMVVWRGDKPLYTPIQDVLSHQNYVFPALTDTSKWHGPPTDAVDEAWDDLYKFGLSAIPGDQMRQMANHSDPIHGLKDRYLISLDVFHQLHCLNTVRKFIWPERYPQIAKQRYTKIPDKGTFDHIDHCINTIRESLMCSVDVTPTIWATGPDDRSRTRFDVIHTCRDWQGVTNWARKNQLETYVFSDTNNTNGELLPSTGHHHHDASGRS